MTLTRPWAGGGVIPPSGGMAAGLTLGRADAPRLTQYGNRGQADPVTQTQTRSPGRQSDPAQADPLRALIKYLRLFLILLLTFTYNLIYCKRKQKQTPPRRGGLKYGGSIMNKYTFNYNGFTFQRVNKNYARRAYKNGLTVVICPCNLKPFTPWHPEHDINRKSREQFIIDEIGIVNDFNNLVNSFEYYNCPNSETGKYAAYYIPVMYYGRIDGVFSEYDYSYMKR